MRTLIFSSHAGSAGKDSTCWFTRRRVMGDSALANLLTPKDLSAVFVSVFDPHNVIGLV